MQLNNNSTKTPFNLTAPMLISCPALTKNTVAYHKSHARHLAKSPADVDGCEFVPGIGPVQKPTEIVQLQKAVNELRPTTVGFSNRGGVAFYSILKATEKVPYESAIFLFAGRAAEDEDLAQITSENLASKRCKVSSERNCTIWQVPSSNGVRLQLVSFKVQTRLPFAQAS
jgi:hypothetical protein